MKKTFSDLGISTPILNALEEMGFKVPTEVQGDAIPLILSQKDVIVISKTGSGKTAAFCIPILQRTDPGATTPQALILTPTRELAVQVDSDLKKISRQVRHKTTAVYGQHSMRVEVQALNKGVSIVTGTPGRLFDHISQGNLKTGEIRFLVLDEADRMLDMGFFEQVVKIIKTLPKDRVTLLFSATIPDEIRRICSDYMKHPMTIEFESGTKTVDTTEQSYIRVEHNEKNTQLNRLLLAELPESCMIFCNTRVMTDRVQSFLSRKGYACKALHGDIPQQQRMKAIEQFKKGSFHILVATDVAARGIHIDELSLVINYDVPVEKDSYIHRIGRTGRAGNGGRAITLVTKEDILDLYAIEEHIGAMISEEQLPSENVSEEHKALAEKWLKDNAKKIEVDKTAFRTPVKVPKSKPFKSAKPASTAKSASTAKPASAAKSAGAVKSVGAAKAANSPKPAGSHKQAGIPNPASSPRPPARPTSHQNHPTKKPHPHQPAPRPIPLRSANSNVSDTQKREEKTEKQNVPTKKSVLQRVIQFFLGK